MRKIRVAEHVKFMHFRRTESCYFRPETLSPHGGATVAYCTDGDHTYAAVAYCSPRDNFSYALGRVKSAGRLNSLLCNPEKADEDVYFVYHGQDHHDFLRQLHAFMCNDLRYTHRGKKKAKVRSAQAQG